MGLRGRGLERGTGTPPGGAGVREGAGRGQGEPRKRLLQLSVQSQGYTCHLGEQQSALSAVILEERALCPKLVCFFFFPVCVCVNFK